MNEIIGQITMVLRHVWRRRWLAAFTAWGVSLAGWTFVASLPDVYESRSLVYVDTANILRPLLQGLAVENDLAAEVKLMQATLLSRPNLTKVLQMTDLHLTAKTSAEMERLLNDVRRRTQVRRRGENLFFISFKDNDPVLARDVVQALLTIFVESNVGQNRRDMETARRFIEQQIVEYEQQLEAAELRLAKFKQENMSLLAGQAGYQVQMEDAETQLAELRQGLRDAELRKNTLEGELKSIPPFFTERDVQGDGPPSNAVFQMLELDKQLTELLARYTEEHPDVVVVRRQLERARAEYEEELAAVTALPEVPGAASESDEAAVARRTPNPMYDELKIALINQRALIATLRDRIAAAAEEFKNLQELATNVPVVEARLTKLNRDYDVLKAKYEQLLNRRESERISRARQAGVEEIQFRITEPPEIPALPVGPKRRIFLTIVLLVALGAGGGLALLMGLLRNTFSSVSEVRDALGLPVLGRVSRIGKRGTALGAAAGGAAFALALLGLVATFGGVMFVEMTQGFGKISQSEAFSAIYKVLEL